MGRAARWLRGLLGVGGGKKKKNTIAEGLAGDGTKQNIISRPRIGNSSHRREETRSGSENKKSIRSPVGLRKSTVRVVGNDEDGNMMNGWRRRIEGFAAVKIQSFFRGYLARKARRALRAIVKLQAVVRGYLVRKQLARTLNTMQALFNAWSQHCTNASPATYRNPMKLKLLCDETKTQTVYTDAVSTSFNGSITNTTDSPLVGEFNSSVSKSSNCRFSSCTFSSEEDRSCNIPPPIKVRAQRSVRECEHRSSSFHVSDEIQSARLVKTPRRSDCTPMGSPNYMLCTKSFMAKIKSQNSPKQRFESRRRAFEAEMGIYAR